MAASNYDPDATTDDGTCSYLVTFSVDLGTVEPNAAGVHLAGDFQNWNPGDTPLQLNEAAPGKPGRLGARTSLALTNSSTAMSGDWTKVCPTAAARQMALGDSTDCGHSTLPPLPDQPWSAGRVA